MNLSSVDTIVFSSLGAGDHLKNIVECLGDKELSPVGNCHCSESCRLVQDDLLSSGSTREPLNAADFFAE